MQVHKQHTGKYLLCKVATLPYISVGIHIVVVSPCGFSLLCAIYNYPTTPASLPLVGLADLDAIFRSGTILALKEPWVKMTMGQGDKTEMLRVDSPTDVVIIDNMDPILKGVVWRLPQTPSLKETKWSAVEWKTIGNKVSIT